MWEEIACGHTDGWTQIDKLLYRLSFKLEKKILGFRNIQEKLENLFVAYQSEGA